MGEPFTILGIDNPVGFFFKALYQTGFYWNFLGFMQVLTAILIVIPRTAFFGAMLYFPIIINIFIIVSAMGFVGTPYIAGLMLLANFYLLFWQLEACVVRIYSVDIILDLVQTIYSSGRFEGLSPLKASLAQ